MPDAAAFARGYTDKVARTLDAMPFDDIAAVIEVLAVARRDGRKVFIVGNGGSASTASHMANDLAKTVTKGGGRPFRAIALTDNVALLTAIANDVSYDEVFAGQLAPLAEAGDVLIAISGSGRSPNVLRALEHARSAAMPTIGLLGMGGGPARELCDVAVVVPSDDYGPIEDVHMILDHLVTEWFTVNVQQ